LIFCNALEYDNSVKLKNIFLTAVCTIALIGCSSSTPEASTTEAPSPATETAAAEGTTATTIAMVKCSACGNEFKKEDMEGAECKKCHEAHGH
jgi:hypothetical protein